MGQALYRKYRSKNLDEIIGQEQITTTLKQALQQGKISHAYLFTGPRGIGKTSIARILAHEINNIPYTDDAMHMDIIEIDAASNRRIDEIRELRDKVHVAPTSSKYKVYIIDEVHMLTKEAFNALLKTLEEPPAHAVFILATTDVHKLPDTIVSRTQRYNFKPVSSKAVAAHLKHIAKQEKIAISDDALELLALHGEGSFRDSIHKLELSDIQSLLGIPSDDAIIKLVSLIAGGSSAEVVQALNALYDQGYQAATIAKRIATCLRQSIIEDKTQISADKLFNLLELLHEVPIAHNSDRFLEISLLRSLSTVPDVAVPRHVATPITEPVPIETPVTVANADAQAEPPVTKTEQAKAPKKSKKEVVSSANALFNNDVWPQVLQSLKQKHNTLYGVIRMAQPTFTDDGVVLTFAFAFHQKRISETANREKLAAIIHELTGKAIGIECVFDKDSKVPKIEVSTVTDSQSNTVSAISNIFGGGELLES
jgi:DNA polymerase-3 subunit gamma/tau